MAEFAYTTVPGKIPQLLQKIREVGVPPKVHAQWLKTLGYTSSNDKTLVGVLRQVGLIDASAVPTPTWTQYRGANYKQVLGNAIRKGYAELYAVYGDAQSRTTNDLEHVFSTSSSAGKQVIGKTVSTFKVLSDQAEFNQEPEVTSLAVEQTSLHKHRGPSSAPERGARSTPSVHIDIQIHISAEASSEQIDQVFRSMSKHLYGVRGTQ